MILFVRDVDTLQSVDISRQTSFVDVSFPCLNSLHQGVVYKDVLLLRLNQVVSLLPDVLQVAKHIDVTPRLNLIQQTGLVTKSYLFCVSSFNQGSFFWKHAQGFEPLGYPLSQAYSLTV